MPIQLIHDEPAEDLTELPTFYFREKIENIDPSCVQFKGLRTLQLNLGNRCNLTCAHCHVAASPSGEKVMSKKVIDAAIAFLCSRPGITLDITGGCPELNPFFADLIAGTDRLGIDRLVRTNLVIAAEPGMAWLPEFYRDHGLGLVASLPCFTAENVDRQRGGGVFQRSIAVLKRLNDLGYGSALELNIVYNPWEDTLPGPEKEMETLYRKKLMDGYGIRFTRLFALTNVPVGRLQGSLAARGDLARYIRTLAECFNPAAASSLMCRTLVSVDWEGNLFNCDFNQAARVVLTGGNNIPLTIDGLEQALQKEIPIRFGNHCFACTAGEGSSCFGQRGGAPSETGAAVAKAGDKPDQVR